MAPKSSKKQKAESKESTGPHHRAAKLQNAREFVCPECWTVPPTIRKDGISVSRHPIPEGSKARKFRDTPYCNGQGRVARYVLDDPWEIGTEPKVHISAVEFIENGTKRIDERLKREQDREAAKAERAAKPKGERKAKPAKPKAPKSGKKSGKARKAKPEADGAATEPQAETPAAA